MRATMNVGVAVVPAKQEGCLIMKGMDRGWLYLSVGVEENAAVRD
jgi:hypothetical protein